MRIKLGEGEKGIYHMYKYYKSIVEEPLEFNVFREVIFTHNKKVMDAILDGASNVRLPCRLGCIRVKKSKMDYKHLKLDYGTYNKTGIKAFHLNEHSEDFKARMLWDKSTCIVKGKRPWSFAASRENKRRLCKLMKEDGGHKRYTEEL